MTPFSSASSWSTFFVSSTAMFALRMPYVSANRPPRPSTPPVMTITSSLRSISLGDPNAILSLTIPKIPIALMRMDQAIAMRISGAS
jgi:hypothetical protein